MAQYPTVPAPTTNVQQPTHAPAVIQQQQQQVRPAAPAAPVQQGIPAYSSQVEGLSVAQVVVNDVIIDLQAKVINETQQNYYDESSNGNYLGRKAKYDLYFVKNRFFIEQLPPIYIRAPNPSIILRSDMQRLRAQLAAKPPGNPHS